MRPSFNTRTYFAVVLIGASLYCALPQFCLAEDIKGSQNSKKNKSNLNFDVPEDWPIEERNGTLGPVPIEKYLEIKFASMNDKLSKSEKLASDLDQRVKVLEELIKKPRKLREGALEEHESEKV